MKNNEIHRKTEIITWKDIRKQVQPINKDLYEIIESLSPKDDLKLIKATYKYGDLLVNNGATYIPNKNGELTEITNSDLPNSIKEELCYQSIPLFLTIHKSNEVFVDTGKRIIPLNIFSKGSLLGVFETIDYILGHTSKPKWSVSAGARSILMLPKITDNIGLNRLRLHYDIPATLRVKYLQDHWELFVHMSNNQNFDQQWQNEVIYFPKSWLLKTNHNWSKFREYIYKQGWLQAQFSITKTKDSIQWEMFAEAISLRNLKPRPYLADQAKHLLAIASGKSPAFRPTDDNQFAPINGIQKTFRDVYLLKNHSPTIMSIYPLFNIVTKPLPLYYSLSFPTVFEGTTIDKSSSTIMVDLRKIKLLMDTLKKYAGKYSLFSNSIIHDIEFKYFHIENDKYGDIEASRNILEQDPLFVQNERQANYDWAFCKTGQFWRGCIMIRRKN